MLTLEAADVAVVGRDEEGRLRRPLVLIICVEEQSAERVRSDQRFGGTRARRTGRVRYPTGFEEEPEDVRQRQPLVHGSAAAAAAPEGTGARV